MQQRSQHLTAVITAALVICGAMIAAFVSGYSPAVAATPTPRTVGVGDWPTQAADFSQSYDNPAESAISPANAGTLGRSWSHPAWRIGPIIEAGGLVISGDVTGSLVALDAVSGALVWTIPGLGDGPGDTAHGTSVLVKSARRNGSDWIYGLQSVDLASGRLNWFAPANLTGSSPLDGPVIAVNGVDVFSVSTPSGYYAQAVREVDGALLWATPIAFNEPARYADGRVFATTSYGGALAYDLTTGHAVTTAGLFEVGGVRGSSVGVSRLGPCLPAPAVCASDWNVPVPGVVQALAVAEDKVLAAIEPTNSTAPYLQVFDLRTGALEWSIPRGFTHIAVGGAMIYAAGQGGNAGGNAELSAWPLAGCHATRCSTPSWSYLISTTSGADGVNALAVAHGRLFAGIDGAGLEAFAPGTGFPDFQGIQNDVAGVSAVSWGPGRLDNFSVNMAGQLVHRWWNAPTGWSGWEVLGGSDLIDTPRVAAWSAGRLDVFVRATGGRLEHIWFWKGWSRFETLAIDPHMTDVPAVATWGVNHLDVFWTSGTSDGPSSLRRLTWAPSWQPVQSIPAAFYGDLSVATTGAGDLEVFGIDQYAVLSYTRLSSNRWSELSETPVRVVVRSGSTAIGSSSGRIDVFALDQFGGKLLHAALQGTKWTLVDTRSGSYSWGPGAASFQAGRIDVFSVTTDLALFQDIYRF